MNKGGTATKNMIYTPVNHIPIGAAVIRSDGSRVLRVKNERTKKYDDFPIDRLLTEVIEKAQPDIPAETRIAQGLAYQ